MRTCVNDKMKCHKVSNSFKFRYQMQIFDIYTTISGIDYMNKKS